MIISPMRRAVYAGSFDPPTNGHLWMIRQAQALFDELIVAIGVNPEKKATYSVEERTEMLRAITADFANVSISAFENQFLVNYAKSIGAKYIIRGIRTGSDYEYERSMRYINHDLQSDISTVFLMPPREYAEVSSTMVKGMVGPGNWQHIIQRYVPIPVYHHMIKNQTTEEK
ncbi:pantetheine-phosphate adenylyltransferase [Neisseriaceae bacterium ESL0693]|nr:pantetheine-phosphate adenylyltransferase [Neisseriaceae bacterium ESL0693]